VLPNHILVDSLLDRSVIKLKYILGFNDRAC